MMERFESWSGLLAFERRVNLYHKQLKFWYNYLKIEKINLCIFMTIPHFGYDYIVYSLCKLIGIPILILHRIPVVSGMQPHIYIFSDIYNHIDNLSKKYEFYMMNPHLINLNQDLSKYLKLVGNNAKTFTGVSKEAKIISKIPKIVKGIKSRFIALNRLRPYLTWYDYFSRSMQVGRKFHKGPALEKTVNFSLKYVYFPLHKQPEASTSPMGSYFVYQDLVVDILLETLPDDMYLFIKPHVLRGNRFKFFERLRKHPKIRVLDPSVNSYDLMINSHAVVTVTGTVGWEAFLNKVPVLMFGNYFYQDAPNVYKVGSADEVRDALWLIQESTEGTFSDAKINAFLMALQDTTFSGWVDNRYASVSQTSIDDNIKSIAKQLMVRIKK